MTPTPGSDDRFAVVVSGPPASGKSTFARALAAATGYALFDLDTVTGPLTRAALRLIGEGEEAVDKQPGATLREPRYESLLAGAAANRALGLGVVVVAPFTRERGERAAWQRVAAQLGSGTVLVYVDCPPEVRAARLAARGAARDGLKRSGVAGPSASVPPAWADIVVSASMSVDDQVADGLAALALPARRPPTAPPL